MEIKEVAYHEAGHIVVGYLFFPPLETTIVQESNRLGNTIANLPPFPFFITNDYFINMALFPLKIKILLFSWAGEFFQRKISNKIDQGGLIVDIDVLTIYFNESQLEAVLAFKKEITETFFENEVIVEMVNAIAAELLIKKKLCHIEIHTILSKYTFDYDKYIEKIMDEYYLPISEKYKEILSTKENSK